MAKEASGLGDHLNLFLSRLQNPNYYYEEKKSYMDNSEIRKWMSQIETSTFHSVIARFLEVVLLKIGSA